MKQTVLANPKPSWPAGVPFFEAPHVPDTNTAVRFPRQASVGPIELHIDGGDGPSAIAILE